MSPLAVRLLHLRDLSRQAPERPAHEIIEPETLAVLAALVGLSPSIMTVGTDLGQRSRAWEAIWLVEVTDPPFWKTLWKGWLHLQALLDGVHVAFYLRL
jgi:hypothetical protein